MIDDVKNQIAGQMNKCQIVYQNVVIEWVMMGEWKSKHERKTEKNRKFSFVFID